MKFIHMTDIHLTVPGNTIAGRDPNANFERAIEDVCSVHGDAEALIITGDLSDWGDQDDYRRLKSRIDALPFPVQLCIGNHDDREQFLSVFPERADDDGFVQGVFDLGTHTGICLDTKVPDTHAGELCNTRLAWLSGQLELANRPVFLFMHHNPVATGQGPIDSIMLRNPDLLGNLIAGHRDKIRHIFFGHCHLPLSGSFEGVPFSAPRGTNHAGIFNFAEPDLLSGSDLPQAYAVVFVRENSVMVDMIEYGYDGPVHVENSPDYGSWDRATMVR